MGIFECVCKEILVFHFDFISPSGRFGTQKWCRVRRMTSLIVAIL
jgi:hypothetical protein